MPKLPVVSWKDIVKLLTKLGYYLKRQGKGDHMVFSIEKPIKGYGVVSVPKHNEIDPGTLRDILEIISDHTGLSKEQLIELLR